MSMGSMEVSILYPRTTSAYTPYHIVMYYLIPSLTLTTPFLQPPNAHKFYALLSAADRGVITPLSR
jgi:hypothetical protein